MAKNNENSRRKFLKYGLSLGAGALAANSLIKAIPKAHAAGIKALTTDGKLVTIDPNEENGFQEPAKNSAAREGIAGRSFVMVIDLSRCKNARKCIEKCQHGHYLPPEQEWMKVMKMQDAPQTAPYWFPKPCYHCDSPSCVSVCPVGATFKREDGVVLVDNEACIGCKYCMVACPYSARTFNWREPNLPEEARNAEYSPETSVPQRVGTVGKCDFCPDLSRNGQLPHCVQGCPMGAIYFGDVNEDSVCNGTDTVSFRELMRDKAGYRFLEEYGTEPRVFYLPPVNRQFPFQEQHEEEATETSES